MGTLKISTNSEDADDLQFKVSLLTKSLSSPMGPQTSHANGSISKMQTEETPMNISLAALGNKDNRWAYEYADEASCFWKEGIAFKKVLGEQDRCVIYVYPRAM